MHIGIITPAAAKSLNGNRATAQRWAGILRQLGHKVSIAVNWQGCHYDMMLALHAWRSAEAIAGFRARFPAQPLIVALTGTDLYRFMYSHPQTTLRSIELADYLVVLHDRAIRIIPPASQARVRVIYQSAQALPAPSRRSVRSFDICVAGHLRDEKDPLRTAYAVRDLPADSRIRVLHFGKVHNEKWAARAEHEMHINPRYHWFGEVPHWQVRRAYGRCHLMVLSSLMEGGANVISEACVAGLPVIASDIDGSVGLLGEDYIGYYPVEDTTALRALLLKAEGLPSAGQGDYLRTLQAMCQQRAGVFTLQAETQRWADLLAETGLS